MKLKKTTQILVLTALVIGCWVALWELPKQRRETNNLTEQKIFNLQENQIRKITISKQDLTIELIAIADSASSWLMVKPEKTLANEAVVAFLVDLLVKGKSDRVITSDRISLAEYGLDNAIATISFVTVDGQTHKIILGKSSIGDRYIYAQVVSPTEMSNNIVLVSKNWQYAVDRDLSEWKQNY